MFIDVVNRLHLLEKCPYWCREVGISLNLEKCSFGVQLVIILLGHIVCEEGLLMDP